MKRVVPIILSLFCLLLVSCHTLTHDGEQLQRRLLKQSVRAEELTQRLVEQLQGGSFDSIWNLTQAEENTLFYVFDQKELVYWSENWLSARDIVIPRYNDWYYLRFTNAHTVCRWTRAEPYNILTVIPIKYAYPFENRQLHNIFCKPFSERMKADITLEQAEEGYRITTAEGKYLFTLVPENEMEQIPQVDENIAESFSYQSLIDEDERTPQPTSRLRLRAYFIIEVALYVLILLMGVVSLIYNRGFRNMKLRTKVYFLINTLVLFVSIYVFAISTVHMRTRYEQQQRQQLKQKTVYIQKALQDLYYWNISLTPKLTEGMNIDLRDLAFTYQTDIQVYDTKGTLVGSSTPALFQSGILSTHIAPEPFFTEQRELMRYEQLGDLSYLTSYTSFVNGNYLPIGYISLPLYLSSTELEQEVNRFLAKLLPPNLIVLLLSFIISFFVVRGITRPLSNLSEKMRHFRIGERQNRLQYENADEVGQLVVRYNEMVEQLEQSTQQLAQTERESAWRTMARQIAHEINNPLTPMKLTIQQLQRTKKLGGEKFDQYFDHSTNLLIEQIDQLSRIAASFSQFARMPNIIPQQVDVAKRLYDVVTLFSQNEQNVPIRYIGPEADVYALADVEQLPQVFNNIIKNALQALEKREEGDIIVMLKQDEEHVDISVSDNAGGIPEDIQEKVFLPNFTTKSTGTGLGLAISKHIVEATGGKIWFETSPKGTTFYIRLPKK